MAGFNFSPIKIDPQPQTSIGDMLNIAKGAQAYQQAQQLNPLQLEQQQELLKQAKLSTQELQGTLQAKIAGKNAEAKRLVIEAEKAGVDAKSHYANQARSVYGGFVTDPDFINGNSKKMEEKLNGAKQYLEDIGIPMHESNLHNKLVEQVKTDPAQAYQSILTGLNIASGPQNQFNQVSGAQNAPIYKGPTPTAEAPPQLNMAPQAATPTTGIQPKQMALPVDSQPIAPAYPVRVAGQPAPAPLPQEVADTNAGSGYRNQLVNRQSNLTTERRNIDEVIKTAKELQESAMPTSGVLGAISRKVSTWAGDPTYIQLSKDLANTTLSNMKALGLSTDADKQLTAAANGDYTYPPEILTNIANRAKADMTNIDMQATAAQNYAKRFGDNNMKSFQQMWSKNADSKVFELMNVANDTNLTKEEKQAKTNQLLGLKPEMTDKQKKEIIDTFRRKKINLLKMTETGTL